MSSLERQPYKPPTLERPVAELDIPEWMRPHREELRTVVDMAQEIIDSLPQHPFSPKLVVTHHVPEEGNETDTEYYYVGLERMLVSEGLEGFYAKAHDQAVKMAQQTTPHIQVHTPAMDISYQQAGVLFDPTGVEIHGNRAALEDIPEEMLKNGITRDVAVSVFANPSTFTERVLPPNGSVTFKDGVKAHIKAVTRKEAAPTICVKGRQSPVEFDTGRRTDSHGLASVAQFPRIGRADSMAISTQVGDPL